MSNKDKVDININSECDNTSNICLSPEDILMELKTIVEPSGFVKSVPFRQGPYLDAPFSQFPNHKNAPQPY